MLTIKENVIYELENKKSKFIACLYSITSLEDVKQNLENVKKKYKGANHYCYAYILENKEKCSDDGEPVGTAGIPILTILRKENVSNVLCIVIRYFGGIKLGTGGLIRSYSKACKEAIQKNPLIELKEKMLFFYQFDYYNVDAVDYLLKDSTVVSKKYDDKVMYEISIDLDLYNTIKDTLNTMGHIKINKKDI